MPHYETRTILAAIAFTAFASAASAATEVELLVLPTVFAVDGVPYESAKAAVEAALVKSPDVLSLPSCGAMKTQRVLDVMAELRGRFAARVQMKTLEPGERTCPDFK